MIRKKAKSIIITVEKNQLTVTVDVHVVCILVYVRRVMKVNELADFDGSHLQHLSERNRLVKKILSNHFFFIVENVSPR